MILKIKEMSYKSLVLKIENGVYYIDVQEIKTEPSANNSVWTCTNSETLETYDAMDYTVKEVIEKLNEIYKVLNS